MPLSPPSPGKRGAGNAEYESGSEKCLCIMRSFENSRYVDTGLGPRPRAYGSRAIADKAQTSAALNWKMFAWPVACGDRGTCRLARAHAKRNMSLHTQPALNICPHRYKSTQGVTLAP